MRNFLAALSISLLVLSGSSASAEERLGASYSGISISPGATVTVFAATANVNGASIRTAILVTGGNSEARLQAVYPDGTLRVFLDSNTSAGQGANPQLSYPILLPPGVGLSVYAYGANPAELFVTYDLH